MSASPAPPTSATIVGASVAGLSAARALRTAGFAGRLTVLGAERHRPYDRPPLSKSVLAGQAVYDELALLPDEAELDLDLRLGTRVDRLLPDLRAVQIDDGTLVESDAVVIATGSRARTLPLRLPSRGVHLLRTLDDAQALREDLLEGGRLVIIGGGFIGCEVASSARPMCAEVTIVEAAPTPLAGAVGARVAERLVRQHREHGVRVECGVGVAEILGTDTVRGVLLSDGRTLEADAVLIAVGAAPETNWLQDSGIALTPDGGVICDESCRASIEGVFAVGDVAAAKHRALGGLARIEHWSSAVEQGAVVAASIVGDGARVNGATAPYFWSDMWNGRLQMAGRPGRDDVLRIVDGDLDEDFGGSGGFAGQYERDTPLGTVTTAVIAYDRPRIFGRLRRTLTVIRH
jgi:3-phenylpropionate/trans-cinnamate dioxygenase ferredoxin reductase component